MAKAISADRWEAVWSADLSVLENLADNGDDPGISRNVDVSFRGDIRNLRALAAACLNLGFAVQELVEADEHGQPWLFLVRRQTADVEAIRELTTTYLQIEDTFGVECDGWGCVAQTGTER